MATIIGRMKAEFNELEQTTVGLAQKFNESVEEIQPEPVAEEPEPTTPTPTPRRSKRKRGTDLTLDD